MHPLVPVASFCKRIKMLTLFASETATCMNSYANAKLASAYYCSLIWFRSDWSKFKLFRNLCSTLDQTTLVWAEIMPGRVTTAQRHSNVKSLWNSSNAWTNATSFKDVFEMNQSIKYTYHSFPLEQKHVKGVQLQLWRHPFTTRSLMISHPDIHLITHDQKFKDFTLKLYVLRK